MRGAPALAAEDYDYVLIDAPPPLEVSDAMPLLALVDGIVLVARAGHTREASARTAGAAARARLPPRPCSACVANCVRAPKDIERYGFSYGAGRSCAAGRKLCGR